MDTFFNAIQTPGGAQGQVGIAFAMALMGGFVNFIAEFSSNDQRKDKLKALPKENFDFIVGNVEKIAFFPVAISKVFTLVSLI